jgi:hypothetical protein
MEPQNRDVPENSTSVPLQREFSGTSLFCGSIAPDELRSSCAKAPFPGAFALAAPRHGTCDFEMMKADNADERMRWID